MLFLSGFLGFNMPLVFPLTVTLVCFYYAQPLLLAWWVARATGVGLPRFHQTGVIVTCLIFGQAAFPGALFSFSVLPSGTYIQGATGTVVLMTYGLGALLASACSLVASRRELTPRT